jgi:flagellar FliL protein
MSEAAPAAKAAPAAAAPAKKSKLPLIIIAAVVACAAIGGGAYFFMSGSKHEATASKEVGKEKEAKAAAVYVKFDPPFVVNFEAKGVMRFLQITLEVMTRDPAVADKIKENEPIIRNDLLLLFGSQTYESISTREGKEKLRADAKGIVAKIIEHEGGDPKKVEDLYFTSFVMQ